MLLKPINSQPIYVEIDNDLHCLFVTTDSQMSDPKKFLDCQHCTISPNTQNNIKATHHWMSAQLSPNNTDITRPTSNERPSRSSVSKLNTNHQLGSQFRCKKFAHFIATKICKPTLWTLLEVLPPSAIPLWKPLMTLDLAWVSTQIQKFCNPTLKLKHKVRIYSLK